MGKLTVLQIEGWIRRGEPVAVSDGDGLTFTLSDKGTATWVLRYRYAGRQKEMTIGRYQQLKLAGARLKAHEARALVSAGKDPALLKKISTERQLSQMTVQELLDDFLESKGTGLRPATIRGHRQTFAKDAQAFLGARLVSDVEPAAILALMREVSKRSYSVAKRLWENLSTLFSHAVCMLLQPAFAMHSHPRSGCIDWQVDEKRVRGDLSTKTDCST